MINEQIEIKEEYFQLTLEIIKVLNKNNLLHRDKLVIGICGESGSGKSTTAKCLKMELERNGISTVILHQDNYYKFPPKENTEKRRENLDWIGVDEVNVSLLSAHIQKFKQKKSTLTVPIVDYKKNEFFQYDLNLQDTTIMIVEGVYTFFLESLDYKIFMEKNYKDTLEKRKKRTREVYSDFVEQVLEIEHTIIAPVKNLADLVVQKDYSVKSF